MPWKIAHVYLLIVAIFSRPAKRTCHLVKYPRVLSTKTPNKVYITLIGNLSTTVLKPRTATGGWMFPLFACFCSPKWLMGVWWHAVMEVLVSEWVKRKAGKIRLPSVAQEHRCSSPLISKKNNTRPKSVFQIKILTYRGYYTAARRYEFYFRAVHE